jgi:hypothetical protein
MGKFEVKICYSGYVTIETEAKDKTEAWDKAQKEIEGKEFKLDYFENDNGSETLFSNTEITDFFDNLERWDEADQINQIE